MSRVIDYKLPNPIEETEKSSVNITKEKSNPTYEIIYLKYIINILSVLKIVSVDERTIFNTIESNITNPDFIEMQIALSEAVRRGIVHLSEEKNKFGDILYIIHQ